MGLKLYLDSCLIIYAVEQHSAYSPIIENVLAKYSDFFFAVTHLSELECLVVPHRNKNKLLIEKFESWFGNTIILPLNQTVFKDATLLRAAFPGLKTPDALHLAAARYHQCDEFWTNDGRLSNIAPDIVKDILKP